MAGADLLGGEAPSARRGLRHWSILALKFVVTAALCWLIVSWIDWQAFLVTLKQAHYGLIALVFILSLAGVVVSAWKWQILLEGHGIRFPLIALIRWYFIAAFFNAFLPTNIGGDGYRIVKTCDNPKGKMRAISAIVLERISGVLTLGCMGYLAAILVWASTGNALAGSLSAIGTMAGIGGLLLLASIRRFGSIGPFERLGLIRKVRDKTALVLGEWRGQIGRIGVIMLLSFCFHLLRISFVWLLILALGTAVDPVQLTVALFAVEVAAMLPISLGGLGVMEGSFVYVMGGFGLDHEAGLAGMLLLRVLTLLIGLIGAVLYLAEGRPGPAAVGT